MKNWFSIKNRANDEVIDVTIHDEIGLWGVTAKDFIEQLHQNKNVKSINLSIHSPGGSVFDGLAIHNALKHHPATVHGKVEGIAASAASFILMAADVATMPENSFLMIHNAHGGAYGEVEDLRHIADVMEKLQNSIKNIYVNRTGISEDEITEMMNVETWMSAAEAMEKGFIDSVTDEIQVAAKTNTFNRHFKNMPIANSPDVNNIESIPDFEKFLRDSTNLSKKAATALTSRAKSIFQCDTVEIDETELSKFSEALDNLSNKLK